MLNLSVISLFFPALPGLKGRSSFHLWNCFAFLLLHIFPTEETELLIEWDCYFDVANKLLRRMTVTPLPYFLSPNL